MSINQDNYQLPIRKEVEQLKPSATLVINERSKALIAEGRAIYKLGFGQSPFPVPKVVVEALRQNAGEKDYLPVRGLKRTREAIAARYSKLHQIGCEAGDVMLGPGSKELIFLFQMAFDGTLLLPSPCWVSYEPQAELVGKKPVFVATKAENNWCLQAEELEQACAQAGDAPKYLILNYPNNPTGSTFSISELQGLAAVCRRHQVIVIADEIYGELTYGRAHHSLATYYPEGTIISTGLSKWAGAGGWRFGAFIFPKEMRQMLDVMAAIASETFSAVSAPVQYAAITAYEPSDSVRDYLSAAKSILEAVGGYVYERLTKINVRLNPPQGGFYLFPDFGYYREALAQKGITSSEALCRDLLEEAGIAMLPGSEFARPVGELNARLCYVDFDGALLLKKVLEEGEQPDAVFVERFCPKIRGAMDAFVGYLL